MQIMKTEITRNTDVGEMIYIFIVNSMLRKQKWLSNNFLSDHITDEQLNYWS